MLLLSGFESSESYPSLPSTSPTPLHFQGDFPDNSPVLIHTLSEELHCRVMCLARDYSTMTRPDFEPRPPDQNPAPCQFESGSSTKRGLVDFLL